MLGLGFSSSMPEVVIREKLAQEHVQAKRQRDTNAASNSDWFGQSSNKVTSDNDELPCLLSSRGLSKYTDIFLRYFKYFIVSKFFISAGMKLIYRHSPRLQTRS